MGHRLSKIYTRTGDNGSTGLSNGGRINKDHIRVSAMGDIDELNSVIGMVLALGTESAIQRILMKVQHELFDLGGELSLPGYALISEAQVLDLENQLDVLNQALTPLKEFILPGGSQSAACCHLARSVCRRAERCLVSLNHQEPISKYILQYVNRLSDLLFVVARTLNKHEKQPDILWKSETDNQQAPTTE